MDLSFIKSLYKRLLNNPGEPAVEETEVVEAQAPIRNRTSKEVEAKIIYDYPKGNFRFPLIPDENRRVERKAPRNENVKHTKVSHRREEPAKQELPPKKVRPFTPTDVPSPVYGFSKPARKEEVEYELNGFLAGEENVFGKMPNKTEELHPAAPQEIPYGQDIPRNKEVLEEGQYIQSVIPSMEEGILEPVVEAAAVSNAFDKPAGQTNEQAAISDSGKLSFENGEQDSLPEKEQFLLEEEVLHKLLKEEQSELKDEAGSEIREKPSSVVLAVAEPRHAMAAGRETEMVSEPVADCHEAMEVSEPVADMDYTQTAPAADPEPVIEKKPSSSRSHLPFNVIMLKQDKKKYEENRGWRQQPVQSAPVQAARQADSERNTRNPSPESEYSFPDLGLLNPPVKAEGDPGWLEERRKMLDETLFNFNVGAKVVNVTQGPSVTRFEVHPEPGVKVNKVTNLADDIKLSLAARDIRIEAPIPGKHTIGIEVPNPKSRPVLISEIIGSTPFRENSSPLTAVLGLDISGNPIVTDLKKMPHGLIAGATGSGKSVCINSILVSLLYKASPDDLKLLLIDPKMVELAPYNRIPHLVSPVITDVKAATASLKWAVEEMERRYELFAHAGVRDINRFNELALEAKRYSEKLPFIVIIIDELADLMMMAPADVEEAICRIAQKARACGIHLIIATQRPSVDVITGLIKANVPTRIAFSVSSQIDSRTIIDIGGAERLLGRGDMLFLENGSSKPVRLQGTFVSDAEIDKVVSFAREQRSPEYLFEQEELLKKAQVTEEEDELFYEACEFVVEQGGASTSSLQRRFKVGYNRAARLIDMMEEAGFISGSRGSKPRDVLITEADLDSLQEAGPVHY